MHTRKRPASNKPVPVPYPVGSSVRVRGGVKDPDRGHSIGGWQGRVTAWDGATIKIAWDRLTLQVMPARLIEWCEDEGFDWSVMWLGPDDVEPSQPRGQPGDTARAKKALGRHHAWAFLGQEGRRIQNVLDRIGSHDDGGRVQGLASFPAAQTHLPLYCRCRRRTWLRTGAAGDARGRQRFTYRRGQYLRRAGRIGRSSKWPGPSAVRSPRSGQ